MPQLEATIVQLQTKRGRPPDLAFEVTLKNTSEERVKVWLETIRSPSVVLQVEDADGRPVLLVPPRIPDPQEDDESIGAREAVTVRYRGFLDRRLPVGSYRIRYHAEHPRLGGEPGSPLDSKWIDFSVRDEIPAVPQGGFHPLSWFERLIELLRRILHAFCRKKCRTTHRGALEEVCKETITVGSLMSCGGTTTDAEGCGPLAKSYEWRAAFDLAIREKECRADVTVRISWVLDEDAQFEPDLDDIAGRITKAWDDKFRLCHDGECCRPMGYPIRVAVEWVHDAPDQAHQDVTFGNKTTHMLMWSTAGLYVDHEFGHMLGPKDEYCTVDGTVCCAPYNGPNIMNGSGKQPGAQHLDWVRKCAESMLGGSWRVVPKSSSCGEEDSVA